MKKRFSILLIVFIATCCSLGFASATRAENQVELYFFRSATCPHCINMKNYLATLQSQHPQLVIRDYEVSSMSEVDRKLFTDLAQAYQIEATYVPVVFVGNQAIVGDQPDLVKQEVERCLAATCPSPITRIVSGNVNQGNTSSGKAEPSSTVLFSIIGGGVVVAAIFTAVFLKMRR